MPAVVNIYTTKEVRQPQSPLLDDPFLKRFFGERFNDTEKQMSLGSGVVVSHDGYVMTNNHVVETADQIEVAFEDGRKAPARLVGTDPDTDLAVIKIDMPNLPAIAFGDVDRAKVGDVVTVFGEDGGDSIELTSLANRLGTIPYELMCGINKRIPRIYLNGEDETEVLQYIV